MLLPPDGMYRQIARRVELLNTSLYSLQRTSLMVDGLLMVVIGVAHWVAYLSIVRPRSPATVVVSLGIPVLMSYPIKLSLVERPQMKIAFGFSAKGSDRVEELAVQWSRLH